MKKILLALVVFIMSINTVAFASNTDVWKDQILYFVLLDRFFDGNKDNCRQVNPKNLQSFHGGDIAGLEQKLGYLEELGITGIWVSPFLKNRPVEFYGQEAYHGYWPYDFFKIDERFGTEEELKSLRSAMKERNMRLLLDMVVNHMGYDAPFVNEHKDWFNPMVNIENWEDKNELKNRCIFGLPDFASQKPEVRKFFCEVSKHWIELLQPDGFRLDAVKHIQDEFWADFNENARKLSKSDFILLGEYLDGNPDNLLSTWKSGGFDSLFDFPLYYTMKEVFGQEGDCRKLASRLYFDRNYPDAGMLATVLDNHDLDRFVTSCKGKLDRYKLAMAFLMTVRGIPTLCYGDEQPLRGYHGKEPHNRCDMKFDTKSEIFAFTKQMIALRKSSEALRRGVHCHLFADKDLYMFARLLPSELVVVAFNNSNESKSFEIEFPFDIQNSAYVQDPFYGDLKCRATITCGTIKGTLAAKSFAIYMPKCMTDYYKPVYESYVKRFKDETAWGARKVTFSLTVEGEPAKGDYYLIGGCDELGNWNPDKAVLMKPAGAKAFEATVELPVAKIVDCKCLTKNGSKISWQQGENTILVVSKSDNQSVKLTW